MKLASRVHLIAACELIELSNCMCLKATYELIELANCLYLKAACGLIELANCLCLKVACGLIELSKCLYLIRRRGSDCMDNYLCMQAPVPMGWLRAGAPAKCRHTVRAQTKKEEPNGSSQTVA